MDVLTVTRPSFPTLDTGSDLHWVCSGPGTKPSTNTSGSAADVCTKCDCGVTQLVIHGENVLTLNDWENTLFACIEKFRIVYRLWRQMPSIQYRLLVCFCMQHRIMQFSTQAVYWISIQCSNIHLLLSFGVYVPSQVYSIHSLHSYKVEWSRHFSTRYLYVHPHIPEP